MKNTYFIVNHATPSKKGLDPYLTPHGIQQTHAIAQSFTDQKIDYIYTSPKVAAWQTAITIWLKQRLNIHRLVPQVELMDQLNSSYYSFYKEIEKMHKDKVIVIVTDQKGCRWLLDSMGVRLEGEIACGTILKSDGNKK